MKKIILILFLVLTVSLLLGCTSENNITTNNNLLPSSDNNQLEELNYLTFTSKGVSFEYHNEAILTEGSSQGIEETVAHLEYAPGVYANILKKDMNYELAAIEDCNWFKTKIQEKYFENPMFTDINFISYKKSTLAGKPACEFELLITSTKGISKLYQITTNHQKSTYTLNLEVIQADYTGEKFDEDANTAWTITEEDSKVMNDTRYVVGMKFFRYTLDTFKILDNKIDGFLEYEDDFLTMKYPHYMTTSVPQNELVYLLFKAPLANSDDVFQENLLIWVFEKTEGLSLKDSANLVFDSLKKEDYTILSQQNSKFLGYDSIETTYLYKYNNLEIKVFVITTLTEEYDISFEYSAEDSEFDKYFEDAKKSASSIKLNN